MKRSANCMSVPKVAHQTITLEWWNRMWWVFSVHKCQKFWARTAKWSSNRWSLQSQSYRFRSLKRKLDRTLSPSYCKSPLNSYLECNFWQSSRYKNQMVCIWLSQTSCYQKYRDTPMVLSVKMSCLEEESHSFCFPESTLREALLGSNRNHRLLNISRSFAILWIFQVRLFINSFLLFLYN